MYSLQPVTQHFLPICVRYSVVLCNSAIHSPALCVPRVYHSVASCSVPLSLNVLPTYVLFHCLPVYIAVLYKYFVVGAPCSLSSDFLSSVNQTDGSGLPSCQRASDCYSDMPDVIPDELRL